MEENYETVLLEMIEEKIGKDIDQKRHEIANNKLKNSIYTINSRIGNYRDGNNQNIYATKYDDFIAIYAYIDFHEGVFFNKDDEIMFNARINIKEQLVHMLRREVIRNSIKKAFPNEID